MSDTTIKICGLTNLEDALAAIAAGADFLGFIMVPESPRFIASADVAAITRELPCGVRKVGVFVNRTAADVNAIMKQCNLDIAQLHGEESADTAVQIGTERVWKVFSLRTSQDLESALDFPCVAVLADTQLPGQRGGTGQVGNWTLAAKLAQQRKVVLAGGLNPGNIIDAISAVHPFAVDCSSGVEAVPGRKDHDKLARFITQVHAS